MYLFLKQKTNKNLHKHNPVGGKDNEYPQDSWAKKR